jgi:hypothetical protein
MIEPMKTDQCPECAQDIRPIRITEANPVEVVLLYRCPDDRTEWRTGWIAGSVDEPGVEEAAIDSLLTDHERIIREFELG